MVFLINTKNIIENIYLIFYDIWDGFMGDIIETQEIANKPENKAQKQQKIVLESI